MRDWLSRVRARPWVAHVLRAYERFTGRLGAQFSAAITYFSVLAIVPLVMVACSIVGFILVEFRPELIPILAGQLTSQLHGVDAQTTKQVESTILGFLQNYAAIGLVGLLSAVYSGAGWMNNLRDALNAQWRSGFGDQRAQPNLVVKTLTSLLRLLGLIAAIAVTFGLASVSTALTDQVISWLGLRQTPLLSVVFSLLPVVFSLAAGWLTFCYVYLVLPQEREPWRVVWRGALIGSVGLAALQYLASFLVLLFTRNKAAAVFGPIIVLMLFFNLFAQLILLIAAWIATEDEPAFAEVEETVRFALTPASAAPADQPAMVPEEVAVRSVRVGLGAGYLTGAATGAGLGALLALLAARRRRRR